MEERNRQIANGYAAGARMEEPRPPAYTPPEPRRPSEPLYAPRPAVTHPAPTPPPEDDNDRLLLLMLAMLLAKNGAQIELIIALLYLAM